MVDVGTPLYIVGGSIAFAALAIMGAIYAIASGVLSTNRQFKRARPVMTKAIGRIVFPSMLIMAVYIAGVAGIRSFYDLFGWTPTAYTEYDLLILVHMLIFIAVTEFMSVVLAVKDKAFERGFVYAALAFFVYCQGTVDNNWFFVLNTIAIGVLCVVSLWNMIGSRTKSNSMFFLGGIYAAYAASFLLFGLFRGPNVGSATNFLYMLIDVIVLAILIFGGLFLVLWMVPYLADKDGKPLYYTMEEADLIDTSTMRRAASGRDATSIVRDLSQRP